MKPLEEELRRALRREEPPEGFTDRVLTRTATAPGGRAGWRQTVGSLFRMPGLRWAAAGTLACLLVAAGILHHWRVQREKAEGELAKVQVMKALRLASVKLNVARRKVQEID